jgi:hypothetical protein
MSSLKDKKSFKIDCCRGRFAGAATGPAQGGVNEALDDTAKF